MGLGLFPRSRIFGSQVPLKIFRFRENDRLMPYGLDRLDAIRAAGYVIFVEGASDCWTAWHYDLPAIGLPGKASWRKCWPWLKDQLDDLDIFLWQEPDAESLTEVVVADTPAARVMRAPSQYKDLSDAHVAGEDIPRLVEKLRVESIPGIEIVRASTEATIRELRTAAQDMLDTDDPLPVIEKAISDLGYGGSVRPVLIVYLCATTRLLEMRRGAMPTHLILIGPSSSGKTYATDTGLALLPGEAVHRIDAGSPRVLLYDDADLAHRVVVFGEADSIPASRLDAGEDNPAASAIRGLAQDGRLNYKVVIPDPSGGHTVRTIDRAGPTVLITTAVRRLGSQLMTRLFELEMLDDQPQLRAALIAQAQQESDPRPRVVPPALLAFQSYLQHLAPWRVAVPFAGQLAELMGQCPLEARVTRDFSHVIALIKAVCILRHSRRKMIDGWLQAEIDDYRYVYDLTAEMFLASTSGVGSGVRDVVDAVRALQQGHEGQPKTRWPNGSQVAKLLDIKRMSATRRIHAALDGGWLINKNPGPNKPFRLDLATALPPDGALPDPDDLAAKASVTPQVTVPDAPTRAVRQPETGYSGDIPSAGTKNGHSDLVIVPLAEPSEHIRFEAPSDLSDDDWESIYANPPPEAFGMEMVGG
jgi:hypothetical protein